jgi:hypothetical protein
MDERHEWKRRAGAVPIALVLALLFHGCETGHFVQRTALTMPLHELGHAVTGWWCGYAAIPSLWKTMIPETRGVIIPLVVASMNVLVAWRGWATDRTWLLVLGLVLGALQLLGTGVIAPRTAQMTITFGGDAGAMVLGTGLMLLFFVGPDSRLRTGGLRYGFLSIGAAALVDTFATWWSGKVPFGEIEGVGLSDPSKLDQVYRWTRDEIIDRYVLVGVLCFTLLALVWAWATWRARVAALADDQS